MSKKLYLLDGSALVYRAYFALQRTGLTNRKGEPTTAVLGFANTLQFLTREEKPDYLAVVFDPPGPTFRHKAYPEYKATRAKMPDELRLQIPWVKELVESWPCALIEVSGMEADDVIGAYAAQLSGPDLEVVAVTGDKDFYQLLGGHFRILNPGRGGSAAVEARLIGPDDIPEKFGVTEPRQVVDVLALMGDSSDNVPGVPGVGPKIASKLISEHGSLENLYRSLDHLKPALREKLKINREQAFLSQDLVTIRTDLELPLPLESLRTKPPGGEKLFQFLDRMDFQRMRKELGDRGQNGSGEATLFTRHHGYVLVSDMAALEKLGERLSSATDGFALHLEADSGQAMTAEIAGIAVAPAAGEAYYVNLGHDRGAAPLSLEAVRETLAPALSDPSIPKVFHRSKFDLLVLSRNGIEVKGDVFDTTIAAYLVDPEGVHEVEALSRKELGETLIPEVDLLGKGAKRIPLREAEAEKAAAFGAERADMTGRLRASLEKSLDRFQLGSLYRDVEIPLMVVLLEMERIGVALDIEFLKAMSTRLDRELKRLEEACHRAAGEAFNVNSPQQLAEVLFERLSLPRGRRTKTGYSTDSEVLESLSPHHELPGLVLEYRRVAKLKSTYVDTLPEMVHPETGRVHASFNQTVAATGRLSSSDPNLQNIPIRTPLGREVRRAFVPGDKGWVLVSADYSQIELRIMAHLSRDPALIEAFGNDIDVHRDTAGRIFGVSPDRVSDSQRAQAKTVNFGVLYGQGPYGLARTLGITNQEAQSFIKSYREQYRGIMEYLDRNLEEARKHGYTTTLLGRRRYLPGLRTRSAAARAAAERLAVNTPIQGSAADLIKVAMVQLRRRLGESDLRGRLLLQVHDELVLESPEEEARALGEMVTEIMEGAIDLDVPIVVNLGIGANWAEIH